MRALKSSHNIQLDVDQIQSVNKFANAMVHNAREYQTAGAKFRTDAEIRRDQTLGKIGEFVVFNYMRNESLDCDGPRLDVLSRGSWDDSYDIKLHNSRGNYFFR